MEVMDNYTDILTIIESKIAEATKKCVPNVLYIGEKQWEALVFVYCKYINPLKVIRSTPIEYNGLHIIRVQEADYVHVTEKW